MKLDAFDAIAAVPKGHDNAIFSCGGHFQLGRYFAGVYDQRVIARYLDRRRQAGKNGLSIVNNSRSLAMERNRSPHGGATEYFIDALMAETDAQNARCAGKAADNFFRNSRLPRHARSWRNYDVRGSESRDLLYRNCIVTENGDGWSEAAQRLIQVVGK